MARPWTLPGAEQEKGDIKMNERTSAVDDFDIIRANIERIKKEQEQAQNSQSDQQKTSEDWYDYGCGMRGADEVDYSCNGTDISSLVVNNICPDTDTCPEYKCRKTGTCHKDRKLSFYEHMELLLDDNDEIINKYFPDPRIQRLIEKYGLKLDNEFSNSGPPNRILP